MRPNQGNSPDNYDKQLKSQKFNISELVDMTYSTLTFKRNLHNNIDENEHKKKMIQLIKSVLATHATKQVQNKIFEEDQTQVQNSYKALREQYIFEAYGTYKFILHKKGKRLGIELFRDADIKDVHSIGQTKKGKIKIYKMPTLVIPERKIEYEERLHKSSSSGENRTIALPWTKQEIRNKPFRVLINNPPQELLNRAFYFDNERDFKKVRDYLKCNKLLEQSDDTLVNPVLQIKKIQAYFQAQFTTKLRQQIRKYARRKETQLRIRREEIIKQNLLILFYNQHLALELSKRWFKVATDINYAQEERKKRDAKLIKMLKESETLQLFNKNLVSLFIKMWSDEAEKRREPDREDINIVFDSLEISKDIVKPTLKVDVSVNDSFPQPELPLNVSGIPANIGNPAELYLGGNIKSKQNENVIIWKLYKRNYDPNGTASSGGLALSKKSARNPEQKFTLALNYFGITQLEAVQIKISLLDENDTLRGYHYVSLKNIYKNSKKGKDIWLSLSAKQDDQDDPKKLKFPLLHLKVRTRYSERLKSLNPTLIDKEPKLCKDSSFNDIFYNKVLEFPQLITPKTYKFIDLLNQKWGFIGDEIKYTQNENNLGEFIQRIKYKLLRYYHKNTSRCMAKLKKSYYLWAMLQDKITAYSMQTKLDQSQILADETFVANLDELKKPALAEQNPLESMIETNNRQSNDKSTSRVVSYLFKRDKWENRTEWKNFYDDLTFLCIKGIPPAERLQIWSELGRVVYFINLTEKVYNNVQGIHDFDNKNLGSRQKKAEDDDELANDQRIRSLSQRVYEKIKNTAQTHNYYVYQQLEDDIQYLKDIQKREKIPMESNIRSICRSFIYWGFLFSKSSDDFNYYVSYSRSILSITQGLLLSQNCTYLEDINEIDEDICFWLLISITTFILPGYFETNSRDVSVDNLTKNQPRKKYKIVSSAMKNPKISGIKSDVLLLKLLLIEQQPEIWAKFQQFGLPLEYYFGDHMLNMFVDLFNPGLVFRIWDLIFLEGSGSNQIKCQRLIICLVYTLLVDCKELILRAKKSSDIPFIINIYAKFQIKYGKFLKSAIAISTKFFDVNLPTQSNQGILDKISIIKFALFSSDVNRFDKRLLECEKSILPALQNISQQNNTVFNLVGRICNYNGRNERLSYQTLANIVYQFIESYGNKPKSNVSSKMPKSNKDMYMLDVVNNSEKKDNAKGEKTQPKLNNDNKFHRPKFQKIQLLIHNLCLSSYNVKSLSLKVLYGNNVKEHSKFNNLDLNFFTQFENKTDQRYIKIEVYYQNPLNQEILKIKSTEIDLKAYDVDAYTKNVIRLNDITNEFSHTTTLASEIEFSILLISGQSKPSLGLGTANQGVDLLKLHVLEVNENYGIFDQVLKLDQSYTKAFDQSDLFESNSINQTIQNNSKNHWKENFKISFEDFQIIIKQIIPVWINTGINLQEIYNGFTKANTKNNFYLIDFFMVLIFASKFALNKKYEMVFDIIAEFEDIFSGENKDEITLKSFKGLIYYLYEIFMVPITYLEVDNMLDLLLYDQSSSIIKITINPDCDAKIDIPSQYLNQLLLYVQNKYYGKFFIMSDQEFMKFIRECFVRELDKVSFNQAKKLLTKNRMEISYYVNGFRRKVKVDFDSDWQIISDISDKSMANKRSLYLYKYILPFNNYNKCINKQDFINYIQKIPLINYLASLENSEISTSLTDLQEIKYEVQMNRETVFEIFASPGFEPIRVQEVIEPGHEIKKKNKFKIILLNWDNLILAKRNILPQRPKIMAGSNAANHRHSRIITSHANITKVSIYSPFPTLVKQIKRQIIKKITIMLEEGHQGLENLSPNLLDENLWLLDYAISIRINRQYEFNISDTLKTSSGFTSLEEIWRQTQLTDGNVNNVDIIVKLDHGYVKDIFKEEHRQLALYKFSDRSSDWYKCVILSKYQIINEGQDEDKASETIDGFAVSFEKFPNEIANKKLNEICVLKDVDFNELQREVKKKPRLRENGHNDGASAASGKKNPKNASPSNKGSKNLDSISNMDKINTIAKEMARDKGDSMGDIPQKANGKSKTFVGKKAHLQIIDFEEEKSLQNNEMQYDNNYGSSYGLKNNQNMAPNSKNDFKSGQIPEDNLDFYFDNLQEQNQDPFGNRRYQNKIIKNFSKTGFRKISLDNLFYTKKEIKLPKFILKKNFLGYSKKLKNFV